MIKPLRQKHLLIWKFLALLLPAGIVIAWLAIPKPVFSTLLQPPAQQALPIVVHEQRKPNWKLAVRRSADDSLYQLEWVNLSAFTFPSGLVYEMAVSDSSLDLKRAILLGRVGERGAYYFPLAKPAAGQQFVLYDIIHHQVIDKIIFPL